MGGLCEVVPCARHILVAVVGGRCEATGFNMPINWLVYQVSNWHAWECESILCPRRHLKPRISPVWVVRGRGTGSDARLRFG